MYLISANRYIKHFPEHSFVFKDMLTACDLQCTVDYINMRKHGMSPDELNLVLAGVKTTVN